MDNRWYKNILTKEQKGRYAIVVAFLLTLFVVAVLFCGDGPVGTNENGATEVAGAAASTSGEVLAAALPVHLSIPAIGVEADFEAPLGVDPSGEIETPATYEQVGWYKYGPTPGELGPSVILGHVDSFEGPAVFWSLGQLKSGDEIIIAREDAEDAVFEVTALERVEQTTFPTQKVYGNIDHAGLRLITCTGTYDHGTLRYSHNLIVYAKLKTASSTVEEN